MGVYQLLLQALLIINTKLLTHMSQADADVKCPTRLKPRQQALMGQM